MRLRLLFVLVLPGLLGAAEPWQQVTMPTLAEAAAGFANPPPEYRAIHWAIWGGQQTKARILADIERVTANSGGVYMINNSRGLQPTYFTPEYLNLVKYTVEQCKAHGLKVWIEGDAGYPDGMAGGMIRRQHPQLGMQAIVADVRCSVAAGQTLKMPMPPDTLGILAYNRSTRTSTVVPMPPFNDLVWTASEPGLSEIVFVRHVYRSSPTRFTNREDGTNDKDSLYTLIDYLDPAATRTYLHLIFDTYEKIVGDEFGKTVLGFRGDETDFTGFMPWTPKLLETFRREKGYDLQPFIPQFFGVKLSAEAKRAKADYWDVWSAMFRDNFYRPMSDWCRARGMEYMVHLNHEETMLDLTRGEDLIRNEGSFFRDMRYIDVPGIDNLNQIGPGIVADFPKLAADAAHVFGHPHVWSEEGGSLGQAGKFVADYQLARGVNFLNIRGLNTPAPAGTPEPLFDAPRATGNYVSRAGYLLSIGRPAAKVALFHPTDSLWVGDQEANSDTVRLTTELLENQVGFDDLDTDALTTVCTVDRTGLRNLSGQVYRAIVVPSCTAISSAMFERLKAFAAVGGNVVWVGRTPTMIYDRTFLHAELRTPDVSFAAVKEPKPEITAQVLAALPRSVKFDAPCPAIKVTHRVLADADVYFFFNESDQWQNRVAWLAGTGIVQVWDATSGAINPVARVMSAEDGVDFPLTLAPHESRFVVIGPVPPSAGSMWPAARTSAELLELGGDWSIAVGDKQVTSALVAWQQLGIESFNGIAEYRKTFNLPKAAAPGVAVYLDLGEVHDVARIEINGAKFPACGWPPYRWEIARALRAGKNALVVQVQVPMWPSRGLGSFGGGNRTGRASGAEPSEKLEPTGVPGGLAADAMRDAAGRSAPRSGGPGFSAAEPQPKPAHSGLIGPVRLIVP